MVPAPVSLLRLVKVVFVLLALGEKVFASRYLLVKIDGGGGGGVAAASDGMVVTQLGGVGRRPRQRGRGVEIEVGKKRHQLVRDKRRRTKGKAPGNEPAIAVDGMNGFQLEKGRDYTTLDRAPIASIDQGGAIPRRVAHPKKSFPKRVVPPSDSFFNSLELPHRKLVGGGGGDGNVVGGDGGNSVSGESMAVSAVEGGGVNKRPPGKELSREVSPLGGQGGKSVGLGEIMQGGKEEVGRRYNDKDDDKEDDSVEEDD